MEQAEPHFLAAGKRDSARSLAQLLLDWLNGGPDVGLFAVRGVIPYILNILRILATFTNIPPRYLLEGNILAARTFLDHFISKLISSNPEILAESSPVSVGDSSDELYITKDQVLNFLQLAIRTCQRAQGDKNKTIREAWVRLCGSYQSKGGLMATPLMRKVCVSPAISSYLTVAIPRYSERLGNFISVCHHHVANLPILYKTCFLPCLAVQEEELLLRGL